MQLIEIPDAASFLKRSSRLLLDAEAENNLLISSALSLARGAHSPAPLGFFIVESGGDALAAALNVPERRLLVSTGDTGAAAFLGRELAKRRTRVKGVVGPSLASEALGRAFAEDARATLSPGPLQRVLSLEKLSARGSKRAAAPGLSRLAKSQDLPRLLEWSYRFVEECGLDEPAAETEEVLRHYLENRQLFVWEDRRPVAMAGFGGQTPHGVRVNMVYTDPPARSRGYAASLVHVVSHRLLSTSGKDRCFLFVAADNVAANKIYEGLGYREVGTFSEFKVSTTGK